MSHLQQQQQQQEPQAQSQPPPPQQQQFLELQQEYQSLSVLMAQLNDMKQQI